MARWDRWKWEAGIEQQGCPTVESLLEQTCDQAADVAANAPPAVRSLEGTSIEHDSAGPAERGFAPYCQRVPDAPLPLPACSPPLDGAVI